MSDIQAFTKMFSKKVTNSVVLKFMDHLQYWEGEGEADANEKLQLPFRDLLH